MYFPAYVQKISMPCSILLPTSRSRSRLPLYNCFVHKCMELVLKSIAFLLPTLSHSISILSYLPHLPPLIISNTNFIKVPTNNSRNFIIPNIHFTSNRTPRNMVRIIKPVTVQPGGCPVTAHSKLTHANCWEPHLIYTFIRPCTARCARTT